MGIFAAVLLGIMLIPADAGILYLALKITRNQGDFRHLLLIAAVTAALNLIPLAGWALALLAFYFLLTRFTDAPLWPDAILIGVVYAALTRLCIVGIWLAASAF